MGIFSKDKTTDKPQKATVQSSAALLSQVNNKAKTTENSDIPQSTNDTEFSDMYITPDKTCYIWSGQSNSGLKVAKTTDLAEFINAVMEKYDGKESSYSMKYKGYNYRVERTMALEGEQFCVRKMPRSIVDLDKLGLPGGVYDHLMRLANKSGLILLSGATGAGKSTTIAALIKKYLETEGGYAFTIEDPIEMPLDGVYKTRNGDFGLCKQTTPPHGNWADGLKSALRCKPRYIYLGEIRSADAALELLRAATSGHLCFSTIHANNVQDSINAIVKYASSSGMSESLAYSMLGNGLLACIHQNLIGMPRRLHIETLFANPNINSGCAVRSMLRSGNINIATISEVQKAKLERGVPLFE